MNVPLFEIPATGWVHLCPKGEYPVFHPCGGSDGVRSFKRLVQVLDDRALDSIVEEFRASVATGGDSFPGVLVDFDHFSEDTDKASTAAGWLMDVRLENGSLLGFIRWTDEGLVAVQGGRFRFLSPTWLPGDCENLGVDRIRPMRLTGAALTNKPNIPDMQPICNRRASVGVVPVRARLDYRAIANRYCSGYVAQVDARIGNVFRNRQPLSDAQRRAIFAKGGGGQGAGRNNTQPVAGGVPPPADMLPPSGGSGMSLWKRGVGPSRGSGDPSRGGVGGSFPNAPGTAIEGGPKAPAFPPSMTTMPPKAGALLAGGVKAAGIIAGDQNEAYGAGQGPGNWGNQTGGFWAGTNPAPPPSSPKKVPAAPGPGPAVPGPRPLREGPISWLNKLIGNRRMAMLNRAMSDEQRKAMFARQSGGGSGGGGGGSGPSGPPPVPVVSPSDDVGAKLDAYLAGMNKPLSPAGAGQPSAPVLSPDGAVGAPGGVQGLAKGSEFDAVTRKAAKQKEIDAILAGLTGKPVSDKPVVQDLKALEAKLKAAGMGLSERGQALKDAKAANAAAKRALFDLYKASLKEAGGNRLKAEVLVQKELAAWDKADAKELDGWQKSTAKDLKKIAALEGDKLEIDAKANEVGAKAAKAGLSADQKAVEVQRKEALRVQLAFDREAARARVAAQKVADKAAIPAKVPTPVKAYKTEVEKRGVYWDAVSRGDLAAAKAIYPDANIDKSVAIAAAARKGAGAKDTAARLKALRVLQPAV